MCDECGCHDEHEPEEAEHASHDAEHHHNHPHGGPAEHAHSHSAPAAAPTTRVLSLEQRVLSQNDAAAAANRHWLAERGVVALNLIASPGAGKTTLLEATVARLRGRVGCAVITGDVRTDHDARRLARTGVPVRQIETLGACHLDAERVGRVLPDVVRSGVRLLFIENVGNLVCPAAFDLGEHCKVALLSTAEGEDKPLKYPELFSLAPVVVLTKLDLAPHLDWNAALCRENLRRVHPGIFVFELSAKTGQGLDAWVEYLAKLVG